MSEDDSGMFSVAFWKRTAERVIRSAAQAVVAGVPIAAMTNDAVWEVALVNAGLMAVLSLATCLAGSRVGNADTPSLIE